MSEPTFITIRNYYPRTVQVDDASGESVTLPVRIRRFTKEQLRDFLAGWTTCQRRGTDRLLVRRSDGDEQERRTAMVGRQAIEQFVVPDTEIRRRRLAEMTPDQRSAFERDEAAEEAFIQQFYTETIRDHVWVEPGVRLVFEAEDGSTRDLRTGADLVDAFGGHLAICAALAIAVHQENTLSADEKKRWRSLSALLRSSPASTPTAAGAAPDATATPAGEKGSAGSGAATDASETRPSGSTTT